MGVLRGGRGSFFCSKWELFPQGKESLCGRKFASFRRAKNCVRTEFERFTQAFLSLCPLPSFSLANCPPTPRGLPWGGLPSSGKPFSPSGGYCPISRIFAFHKGLVGRIPLSRGEPSNESTTTMLKFDIHKTCTKTAARAGRIDDRPRGDPYSDLYARRDGWLGEGCPYARAER